MAKQYEELRPIQFRLKTLFLIVAIVAVGIWLVGNSVHIVWIGHVRLTLHTESRSSRAIKSISYAAFHDRGLAEMVAKDPSGPRDVSFDPVIEDDGQTVAFITLSGRTNRFGHEISYHVHRHVVLHIQYADGREHRTVFEVPPGRGPRSVTVTVP